jgi:hypothetical protein
MPLNVASAMEIAILAVGFCLPACSASLEQQTAEQEVQLQAPSRTAFPPVSDALQMRCATLDCHGQVGRNLRLYGYSGLRLAATQSPLDFPTTDAEYQASYESVVGLEPEVLSKVVALQADPNSLSMIRKARGIEHHKGGQQMQTGDALDRCIVLWLQNKSDASPCTDVVEGPHPITE